MAVSNRQGLQIVNLFECLSNNEKIEVINCEVCKTNHEIIFCKVCLYTLFKSETLPQEYADVELIEIRDMIQSHAHLIYPELFESRGSTWFQ